MKTPYPVFILSFILLFVACSEPKQQDNTVHQQTQITINISNNPLENNNNTDTTAIPITTSPTNAPINFQAASNINHNQPNNLPPSCQHYYQIANNCFAKQNNAQSLQNMLAEQMQALTQQMPTESECQKLHHSFQKITQKLNCHFH